MANEFLWKVEARDKNGRVFASWHSTKDEAKAGAANCRGRYPYGNRVKIVKDYEVVAESDTKLKSGILSTCGNSGLTNA